MEKVYLKKQNKTKNNPGKQIKVNVVSVEQKFKDI